MRRALSSTISAHLECGIGVDMKTASYGISKLARTTVSAFLTFIVSHSWFGSVAAPKTESSLRCQKTRGVPSRAPLSIGTKTRHIPRTAGPARPRHTAPRRLRVRPMGAKPPSTCPTIHLPRWHLRWPLLSFLLAFWLGSPASDFHSKQAAPHTTPTRSARAYSVATCVRLGPS